MHQWSVRSKTYASVRWLTLLGNVTSCTATTAMETHMDIQHAVVHGIGNDRTSQCAFDT